LTLDQTSETIERMTVPAPPVAPRRRHHTLAEAAVAELQDAIYSGKLAPGMPLRLEELAHELGMSISPVREAVRRLESLGLAVHVPHRGAWVSELAIEDLHDTYEVRLTLETLAVRRAAARFTDADAAAARAALDRYAGAHRRDETREARRAHTEFHFALYAAAGSDLLVRVIRPAWENAERYRAASLPSRGTLQEREQEHQRILDACLRQEPDEAARELYGHLAVTANLVAHQMGAPELFAVRTAAPV
jgi:DNA-binding GntR family transcriptional regulator